MMMMVSHTMMAMTFSMLLLIIILILSRTTTYSRNKFTPFECGFDPKDSARLPFSMRFFLLTVVFLIFDIEIALLFPIILGLKMLVMKSSIIAGMLFLLILLIGLVHEWKQGALSWVL